MWKRFKLMKPEDDASGGGGAAPAPAPAAPAPAPAAPATSPAAPAPAPAAPAPGPAAPAPSPAAPAPAPAADVKATWPENWRETVGKDDAKRLAQLQRYASPEAAIQALFAAQDRIRSGELKPVLGKNATAEELAEWRTAHGIPATPDKYDLGKDVKIDEPDKPMFDVLFKEMHAANATPEHLKATVKTWNQLKNAAFEHQAAEDAKHKQAGEDALRAEWGTDFRRNKNLIQGLIDFSGSQELGQALMNARLPDGRRLEDTPEAMKMLVGLALINNPTGVVVPGGTGATGEGIREELDKLQKIPAAKKTDAQSERQRGLIDHAVKAGMMDANGAWKK